MGFPRFEVRLLILFIALPFLIACSGKPKTPVTVALQPFDNFDSALSDSISSTIKKTYGVDIVVLKSRPLPREAYVNIKTPRYRADRLIRILKTNLPDSIDYIVGLTHADISTTSRDKFGFVKEPKSKYEDWGIFGYGYRPGQSCVVSTFRIGKRSDKRFMDRLKKISIHELGHNLGLDHCDTKYCVMSDAAETIKTIDAEKSELCSVCKNDLW